MKLHLSKKVVIGGTFETLHRGQKALLERSFGLGEVFIGLTSNIMAEMARKRKIKSFELRKKELQKFIKDNFGRKAEIAKIGDKFGPTLERDFDYMVVSPETCGTALLINKERKKINKKPIKIVKIKFVLAKDKKIISSTRIIKGEIDSEGNLL